MKKITLLLFSAIILFVASCSKDDNENPGNNSDNPLIKRMVFADTSGQYLYSFSYVYDDKGRVSEMIADEQGVMDSVLYKYHYSPSRVNADIFYKSNSLMGSQTIFLNSSGLADSLVEMHFYLLDTVVYFTTSFQYNPEGYMTLKTDYVSGDTSFRVKEESLVSDGNKVSMLVSFTGSSAATLFETYSYYPNSINTLGNVNTGKPFLGKSNSGLVKSTLTQDLVPPDKSATYTYTVDSQNRVTGMFVRGESSTLSNLNLTVTYY
jgi:hypothetical protein